MALLSPSKPALELERGVRKSILTDEIFRRAAVKAEIDARPDVGKKKDPSVKGTKKKDS